MPLTNAEKVRRYRERQKAKKKEQFLRPSSRSDLYRTPFFQFFPEGEQTGSQYGQSLELAGFTPVSFEDDTGPEASTLDHLTDDHDDNSLSNPFGASSGTSLGKAEVIIGCLLDAASDLANWVNAYKRAEITARLNELAEKQQETADERRATMVAAGSLQMMLDQLDRQVRWPLPAWATDGERDFVPDD